MNIISKRTASELIVEDELTEIEFEIQQKGRSGLPQEILEVGHDGWNNANIQQLQYELDNRMKDEYIINPEL